MNMMEQQDLKLSGQRWIATTEARVISPYRSFTVKRGTVLTLTGWYEPNHFYVLEYPNYYIDLNGWNIYGDAPKKTQREAQAMINKLLSNNQYIYENNLLLARFSNRLSATERERIKILQGRLEEREYLLRNAEVFSSLGEAQIRGYSNYYTYLKNLCEFKYNPGIGIVISTTAAIIIGVVVIASLAAAAYYAFENAYKESVQDVKLSKKMLEVFEKYKMTDEDVAIIQKETQGIVTKATLMQKIKTGASSYKNIIIIAALAFAGYTLYKNYKK